MATFGLGLVGWPLLCQTMKQFARNSDKIGRELRIHRKGIFRKQTHGLRTPRNWKTFLGGRPRREVRTDPKLLLDGAPANRDFRELFHSFGEYCTLWTNYILRVPRQVFGTPLDILWIPWSIISSIASDISVYLVTV